MHHVTITDVNGLFPDFRSIYYNFPLSERQLRLCGIHYTQTACLLFDKIIMFILFFIEQNILIDAAWRTEFFCIRYFSKTKSKPPKKIQGDVFLLN